MTENSLFCWYEYIKRNDEMKLKTKMKHVNTFVLNETKRCYAKRSETSDRTASNELN